MESQKLFRICINANDANISNIYVVFGSAEIEALRITIDSKVELTRSC